MYNAFESNFWCKNTPTALSKEIHGDAKVTPSLQWGHIQQSLQHLTSMDRAICEVHDQCDLHQRL